MTVDLSGLIRIRVIKSSDPDMIRFKIRNCCMSVGSLVQFYNERIL